MFNKPAHQSSKAQSASENIARFGRAGKTIIITFLVLSFLLIILNSAGAAELSLEAERFSEEGQFQGNFLLFLEWLFPAMLAVATILAVLVLIFAGFKWMAGAVSPPQVEDAKKWIWAAIIGLSLALLSFLILKTINPDLIELEKPTRVETQQRYV